MYQIEKHFAFSASHSLSGLNEGHQCARLHGHNYDVVVRLSADTLDSVGFVLDYGALAPIKDWIDTTLDHRHLNDALQIIGNPTAEKMAEFIARKARDLLMLPTHITLSVGVSETPKTWAWWTP